MEYIYSDTEINIEDHFKISAGPGAGKTYWLIKHIKNVLRQSKRLNKTAKIACITYTNIASEEIKNRLLELNDNKIEVNTIHGFLYKNVVKPYIFLLKDNDNPLINIKYLDGHYDHIPHKNILIDWVVNYFNNKYKYLVFSEKIVPFSKCVKNHDWIFNDNGELEYRLRNNFFVLAKEARMPNISQENMLIYKKYYWDKGIVHHEDILYLSYRLLNEYPKILVYLSKKFPYLFVDEFQDTNPIQTKIVKKLGSKNTVIGIIGDSAQSIYGFQGARREDFINFTLDNLKEYSISDNRRSTGNIISFLNSVRIDLSQNKLRDEEGDLVKILVGKKFDAINYVKEKHERFFILARNNATVSQVKLFSSDDHGDLWEKSRFIDGNQKRQNFLYSIINAVELVNNRRYGDALKQVKYLFRRDRDGNKITKRNTRRYSIFFLSLLVKEREKNIKESIKVFHNKILKSAIDNYNIKPSANITNGKYANFASEFTYSDFIASLNLKDENGHIRTIHKSKGAEFDNVLIVFEESDCKFLYDPKIKSKKDDTRIYYVGFSRARENLFINIPSLMDEKDLCYDNFEIINL